MKLLYFVALAALPTIEAADLNEVKTVYLMPMSRGLDQYLAERLTGQGVLQVVTDPKRADAVITDRVGGNFEQSMADLYEEKKPKSDKAEDNSFQRPSMQPLSSGKGNIFLVDRKSRDVLWSTFVVPKTTGLQDLNRTADAIVDKLAKARGRKK